MGPRRRWDLRRALCIAVLLPGPDAGCRRRGAVVHDPDPGRLGGGGAPLPDPGPDCVAFDRTLDRALAASQRATSHARSDARRDRQAQADAAPADAGPDARSVVASCPRSVGAAAGATRAVRGLTIPRDR